MKTMRTMMALALMAATGIVSAAEPTPDLEQRVKDLEKKLQAIESIPLVAMALNARGDATPAPTPQADAPLELVSWTHEFKRGQYNFENRHVFGYTLKNRTQKAIKMIDADLVFTDLLGQTLMGIRLNPDLNYPAGESKSYRGDWSANEWDGNQMRLLNMKHDDVKATLTVRRVLFTDGSAWSPEG